MRKPDGGIRMMTDYNKHLRSGQYGHKRGSMSRAYWKEWRAKARQALRKEAEEAEDESRTEAEEGNEDPDYQ